MRVNKSTNNIVFKTVQMAFSVGDLMTLTIFNNSSRVLWAVLGVGRTGISAGHK